MSLNAVKVLGISVTNASKKEVLEYVEKGLFSNLKTQNSVTKNDEKMAVIVTPNAEQLVYARRDSHFANILNRADVAVPDSVGVVWAMKFLHNLPSVKRIPGVELMEELLAMAVKERVRIGLIGGRAGVAVEALERLRQKHPSIEGEVFEAPEFEVEGNDLRFKIQDSRTRNEDDYFKQLAQDIRRSGVQLVFLALGPPKQEYFMERLARELSFRPPSRNPSSKNWIPGQARDDGMNIILMSVGGSLDIISGRLPRAPLVIRSIGFEWLWRLLLEPRRIVRQLALLKFVWLVLQEKYFK